MAIGFMEKYLNMNGAHAKTIYGTFPYIWTALHNHIRQWNEQRYRNLSICDTISLQYLQYTHDDGKWGGFRSKYRKYRKGG